MSDTPAATTAPRRRAIPPPTRAVPPTAGTPSATVKSFSIGTSTAKFGERILFYGTGGIGKSTLAKEMEQVGITPVFIDFDGGTRHFDPLPKVIHGVETWSDLRAAVQQRDLFPVDSCVVIDTYSRGEEKCVAEVVSALPADKQAQGLEGFGYGKGHALFADERLRLLADLDRLIERGTHVMLICHDIRATIQNPNGENYLRYEPMVASTDKNPFRDKLKGWADHVLFADYEIAIENKKASGTGSRVVHCQGQPGFIAKSRTLIGPYPFTRKSDGTVDVTIWKHLFDKE